MHSKYESAEFSDATKAKLEPRLEEYLKQKKFNRKHNIQDDLLEKEYSIDKKDIGRIKMYIGEKRHESEPCGNFQDHVDPRGGNFPSMEQEHDKRLDRIKEKQRRDKEANEQRTNYDMLSRGYDMYRDDRKFASASGNDFKSRFDPAVWFENGRNVEELEDDDTNPNVAQVTEMRQRYANTNVYKNVKPKIDYKDYMTRGCHPDLSRNKQGEEYSLDSIIGKLDSYKHNVSRTYDKKSELDIATKVVVPHNNCNNKRDGQNQYQTVPYMNGPIRDVDAENYLAYGSGQVRAKKSRGYPNPVEHHFSYISSDIQNPDHVVFERGMPSRMFNKTVARKYSTRDVLP